MWGRHVGRLTVVATVMLLAVGGGQVVQQRLTAHIARTAAVMAVPSRSPSPTPSPSPAPPPVDHTRDAVQAADAAAARYPKSRIGLAVLDRTTGTLALGQDGAAAFLSASVVKLYTVVDVLHRASIGEITLTAGDRIDIDNALRASDDEAMDALWSKFGGAGTVSDAIALVGLHDSRPPTDSSQWGETTVSARDVVAVYDYVLTTMDPTDRSTIMNDLAQATDTGADGFDQAFGLLDPPRAADVAAKQGWMWIGSQLDLHSTGVLGPDDRYVVVILSENPASIGQNGARAELDAVAAALEMPIAA